eukprot:6179016-Pyramimonas_sp.AAC.1
MTSLPPTHKTRDSSERKASATCNGMWCNMRDMITMSKLQSTKGSASPTFTKWNFARVSRDSHIVPYNGFVSTPWSSTPS